MEKANRHAATADRSHHIAKLHGAPRRHHHACKRVHRVGVSGCPADSRYEVVINCGGVGIHLAKQPAHVLGGRDPGKYALF
jgi:hypothetical protein